MTLPVAVLRAWARLLAVLIRRSGMTASACLVAALVLLSPGSRAEEVPGPPPVANRMTDAEIQSLGCAVAAAVAGAATVAAGGVALIAAEVGVGSAGTAVAVPVLVATMAGACSLGNLATPAVLWLSHKGTLLGSAVVRTVAEE